MVLAGLDFGLKKVGVAIASSTLSEPYSVIRYVDFDELIKKIKQICEKEHVEKIVVGISEGEMAEKTKVFSDKLKQLINIPVEFFDETLTTHYAQKLAIEAGVKRSKRKRMEDAYSASVMLQNYLDR